MDFNKSISRLYPLSCSFLLVIFTTCSFGVELNAQEIDTISIKMKRDAIGRTTTITSDLDGFIWLGTLYGIQRYDGENYINIRELAPHINFPKDFEILYVDQSNNLWIICSESGIYRINLNDYESTHFADFNSLSYAGLTYSVFESEDGKMYFPQINELVVYDEIGDSLIHHDIKIEDRRLRFTNVVSQRERPEVVYLSAYEGVFEYNIESKEIQEIVLPNSGNNTRNIMLLDYSGHLWVNTWYDNDYGLIKYDIKSKEIVKIFSAGEDAIHFIGNTDIWDMAFLKDHLWIASNNGFWQIDINTDRVSYIEIDDGFNSKNRINQMRSMHIDHSHNIWLGSNVNVYHSSKYEKEFGFLKPSDEDVHSLITSPIETAANIGSHHIAIGTSNGISIYNTEHNTFNNFTLPYYNGNNYNNSITSFVDNDDHSYWVGTWSGLYLIEDETNEILQYYITFKNAGTDHPIDKIHHDVGAILSLYKDDQGTVWFINNYSEVGKLEPDKKQKFKNYKVDGEKRVIYMQLLKTEPWGMIAGTDNGLRQYDENMDSWVRLETGRSEIDNNLLRGLANGNADEVYALSDSHLLSISKLDGRDTLEILVSFDDDRIKSNPIVGQNGNIWILTEDGIIKYDIKTQSTFFFESSLYLDGLGFNLTSGYVAGTVDDHGKIYMAGDNGLSVIDPAVMNFNTSMPEIRITGIESNGELLSQMPSHKLNHLNLSPSQDNLILTYTAINDHLPSKTRFKYMLDGINDEWIDVGSQKSIALSGLAPGYYKFKLSAISSDGISMKDPLLLSFRLRPPFHKTHLAYLVYLLLFLWSTYLIYRWRFNQRLKRELYRTKISRDLHDEVGGILTGIALKSDLAQMNNDNTNEVQTIARMSRAALSKMSDVLWSIDARRDNTSDLIIKMKAYCTEMCNVAGIDHQFAVNEIRHRSLNHEKRKNIFLIFKEAINNVIKHSNATHLEVKIHNDQQFEMIIKDNGVGETSTKKGSGQGLENLKSRTKEINGIIHIKFKKGCTVHLRCPKI